jgi:alkylation response protein AidB-like acyl-CoA dehydrogenase
MRAATDCAVFARTSRRDFSGFTIFVLPLDADGVSVTPHELTAAAASGTSMLDLDGVVVGDERRAGGVGLGLPLLLDLLRGERVLAGVAALSVAKLCLEIALAYAGAREVGGQRLRDHQVVAHRLADMASQVAAGRALARERVASYQDGRLSSADAAQAKLVLGRIAWAVADDAVQVLGGRGYTEETPLARIWRDIRIARIGGGSDEVQLELVAQSLRAGELADHPAVVAAAEAAAG